jgi:NAD(P)-dependent dehydrogenase (short-subunit alcohol dehydrogenase family)
MGEYSGKVAIVTGGGAGLGKAIALAFAKQGANVVVSGRTLARLEETVREIEAAGAKGLAVQADVARREDAYRTIEQTVAAFGRIDALINNAQVTGMSSPIAEMGEKEYHDTVDSGIGGTLWHMQAAYPHLKETKGAIVNFGSRQGIYGAETYGAYAAAKEGIRGLSRTAAREFGPAGIRVNVVNPAAETDAAAKFFADNPGTKEWFENQAALRYIGTPEDDIAPVVLFLCSDAARYLTGQTLCVEGGQTML